MNSKTLISLSGGVISNPARRLPFAADFELREGENIALVGPCGSGKSTLLEMLRGGFYLREGSLRLNFDREAYKAIRTVEFDNAYSTSQVQYYHQQRWQAFEREAAPLVGEILRQAALKAEREAGCAPATEAACCAPSSDALADAANAAGATAGAATVTATVTGANTADTDAAAANPAAAGSAAAPNSAAAGSAAADSVAANSAAAGSAAAGSAAAGSAAAGSAAAGSAAAGSAAAGSAAAGSGAARSPFSPFQRRLFDTLNIAPLMDKAVITLSSGELRRFHIAKALLCAPKVLMIESPFIGLDPPTRHILDSLMQQVSRQLGISFIVTLTESGRMPAAVTHAYFLDGKSISPKMTAAEARGRAAGDSAEHFCEPAALPLQRDTPLWGNVVQMRGVNISYGARQIFRNLDWSVHSGQKWNVTGPNGSGKSTLLSLVNADNPAAYSQDITLFDRRRGSGESIWEIKRHIGYLSGEMHSSYRTPDAVMEVLRGGLCERFGGLPQASAAEAGEAAEAAEAGQAGEAAEAAKAENQMLLQWLRLFGAEHLAGRNYLSLSSGEQRYVLLIRAFVKNPDLLILDEPFQGLDPVLRSRAAAVIGAYCRQKNKTLIFVTHYIEELPSVVTHTLALAHLKTL